MSDITTDTLIVGNSNQRTQVRIVGSDQVEVVLQQTLPDGTVITKASLGSAGDAQQITVVDSLTIQTPDGIILAQFFNNGITYLPGIFNQKTDPGRVGQPWNNNGVINFSQG